MKYSADKRIAFEDESHSYFDTETGDQLTSVTTVLKQWKQDFDEDTVSNRCAIKEGVSQDEILERWSIKRDLACELGTYLHQGLEDSMNGLKPELDFNKYAKAKIVQRFIKEVLEAGKIEPVLVEPIAYSLEHGIAGQVDLVGKTSKGIFVFDWKTNEEMKTSNFYQQMKIPFRDLDDCNFNHYQIQLNTYRELLQRSGQHIDGMFVVWFDFFEWHFMKVKEFEVLKHL
jgi:ATP-dependent exoDNAse (exonuclease V) beta subunit